MSGKKLKVDLVANTSQFKRAMSETSNQMKLINSEFKSAAAETDKYGNRLDATGAKKRQLSGVIEQYRHRIKAIKDEQKHWTNELKKGNITEEQHAQKQQELARRLNNTEAEMKRYEGQLKRLNTEGKNARMTFDEFDKKFRDVGRTMRNVGAQVGITAGVGFMAMKRVLGDVVQEASSFHTQMSEVQAISGATTSEIKMLTDQSKELGRQTKFTAQEAAESQANLARAGFKVNEIYDAMPGLLDLAASSNLDLGTSANITSNIIRTFNKDASESGKIADVLAKGAATANTDVQGLGESMKTAGPVANSLGISFESVAAATGIMADAGIEGSQSGRMLRQGMLRLSKPTGEAGKLIKKMGIDVFDADGNMKSLDKVVAQLSEGMEGYTGKQKAAALATIFGSESTAGWTVLLDKGADALGDYTVELENSEGAAKEMADTMQDNAEGAIIRMQSALSGLKIELGEKLLPTLGKGADAVGNFANYLAEMDDATIQTVAETALLVTAVLGVTTAVAGLVAGIGAFMAFAGPVGAAIAVGTGLLGGLGAAIYKSKLEAEQAEKVNVNLAKSLTDQALELDKNVNTFDKLSDKAKISNAELAELYDINQRIAQGGSSEEIAKLQAQYDKLAEKSGLSKDELKELFGANEVIIDQSPNVEKSISSQGNAFVESTEKVREYVASLLDASKAELKAEREKQLQRQNELTEELIQKERELAATAEALNLADEIRTMSQEEILELLRETQNNLNKSVEGTQEWHDWNQQLTVVQKAMTGHAEDYYDELLDIIREKRESYNLTKEELAELEQQTHALADVYLQQVGINEQGEKGLISLEEKLLKNHEELAALDKQLEKNGQLTTKQQEKYDKLVEQNAELNTTQDYLNNELELYGTVNSLVESKKHLLGESTQERIKALEKTHEINVEEGNIVEQIQKKHSELLKERDQLEENREKQGANKEEIDKQIAAIDEKINKGDDVILSILKELDVLELVKDGIQLNSQELDSFLVGLGYTVDEAAEIARVLVGDTVTEMEGGAEKAEKAGKDTGESYGTGIGSTKGQNETTAKEISDLVEERFSFGKPAIEKHGKDKGDAHNKGLGSTKSKNTTTGKGIAEDTVSEMGKGKGNAQTHGKDKGDAHESGLSSTKGLNVRTSKQIVDDMLREIGKGSESTRKSGKSKGDAHEGGLSSTRGKNTSTAGSIVASVTRTLGNTSDGGGGSRAGNLFSTGLSNRRGSAQSAGSGVARSGEQGLRSISTSGAGSNFVAGFRGSINSGGGSVWSAAWSLGKSALSALKSSIRTASPSKETEQVGDWFTEGFTNKIDEGKKKSINSAKILGKETLGALQDEVKQHKNTFGAMAMSLETNKESLKVEHTLDNKFNELISSFNTKRNEEDGFVRQLLQATLEQNNLLMQLLKKDTSVIVDADSLYNNFDKRLYNDDELARYMKGAR